MPKAHQCNVSCHFTKKSLRVDWINFKLCWNSWHFSRSATFLQEDGSSPSHRWQVPLLLWTPNWRPTRWRAQLGQFSIWLLINLMLGKFKAEALPVVIDILFTYFFFGKNNWTGINIYFLFSLEHCVAAWEHPLLSLSLLLVRTIWQRRYVNEQFRFKLLTLDPPTVLEKKFSRLPFCVLSFVIWMKEINTDEMLINTNRNGGSRRCLWSVQLHKTRCQSQPGAKGSSKYLRSFSSW